MTHGPSQQPSDARGPHDGRMPSTPFAAGRVSDVLGAQAETALPDAHYAIDPTVGGIVHATFRWWRADLARLFTIGLIPYGVMVAAGLLAAAIANGSPILKGVVPDVGTIVAIFGAVIVVGLVVGVAYLAAQAGSIFAAEETARGDRTKGAFWCFVQGLGSLRRVLGFVLLGTVVACVSYAVPLVVGAVLGAMSRTLGELVSALLQLPLMIASAVVAIRLTPVVPVYVLEDLPLMAGVRRAWDLTRGCAIDICIAALVVGTVGCMGAVAMALFAFVPAVGFFVSLALWALLPPLGHTFVFAAYAAALARAQGTRGPRQR